MRDELPDALFAGSVSGRGVDQVNPQIQHAVQQRFSRLVIRQLIFLWILDADVAADLERAKADGAHFKACSA